MVNIGDWVPMSPLQGPPLPRFLNIFWPWIKGELPPEEQPPGEPPPGEQPPEEQPPEEPPPEEQPPPGAEFYMPATMAVLVTGDGQILDRYWNCHVSLPITNRGVGKGTQKVRFWDSVGNFDVTQSITLEPGGQYIFSHDQWIDFNQLSAYTVYAEGDWPENYHSVGECKP